MVPQIQKSLNINWFARFSFIFSIIYFTVRRAVINALPNCVDQVGFFVLRLYKDNQLRLADLSMKLRENFRLSNFGNNFLFFMSL
jgi:hypothetical protein